MAIAKWALAVAVIGAAALVGCGNDNSPPAGSTTPPPAPAPAAPTPSQAAEPAAAPTPAPAAPAPAAAAPAAAAPAATPGTTPPATTTPSAMEAAKTQADQLMTQAYDYVKNNKMDLAEQAVTKLQEMKPNLPAEYGPRIDQLKAAVDAAKSAGGKLPGGFKMPGQ